MLSKLVPETCTDARDHIVRFDCLAVLESFWYQKLAPNRAAFYSVKVSGRQFLERVSPLLIPPKGVTNGIAGVGYTDPMCFVDQR